MKDYQGLLTRIYQRYNPEKLDDVPRFLEKYAGREEELLQKVLEKYNTTLEELESSPASDPVSESVVIATESVATPDVPEVEPSVTAPLSAAVPPEPVMQAPIPPPPQATVSPAQATIPRTPVPPNKTKWGVIIGVSAAAIIVLVIVGIFLVKSMLNKGGELILERSELAQREQFIIDSVKDELRAERAATEIGEHDEEIESDEAFDPAVHNELLFGSQSAFLEGFYLVSAGETGRAYFHNQPDASTARNAFVVNGDVVYAKKIHNQFVFVEFTNDQDVVSSGWILRDFIVEQ